jgi:hypothetical protein
MGERWILGSNSNPVNFGARLGENLKQGMNKTNWRQVGKRLTEEVKAATDWRPLGKRINQQFRDGFSPVDLGELLAKKLEKGFNNSNPVAFGEKYGKKLRKAIADKGWFGSGKNAALGFLKGFQNAGAGVGIVEVVDRWREGVKKWQKEDSPAKLWMVQGKNAALGYLQGFRDTKIGEQLARDLSGAADLATRRAKERYQRERGMRRTERAVAGRGGGQLGPGDPGYLDDGFRQNSRQSPGRGKYGYVQAEDGSWVYNPALYREEQARRGGGSSEASGASGGERERQLRLRENYKEHLVDIHDRRKRMFERAARLRGGNGSEARAGLDWSRAPRGANKDELAEVMDRHANKIITGLAKAMQQSNGSARDFGHMMENSVAPYLNHRNAMGADPR